MKHCKVLFMTVLEKLPLLPSSAVSYDVRVCQVHPVFQMQCSYYMYIDTCTCKGLLKNSVVMYIYSYIYYAVICMLHRYVPYSRLFSLGAKFPKI